MAQAFLLKTADVAVSNSSASQKHIKNQATDTDESKVESFSSALDKQVDKQAIQQKKTNKVDEADNSSAKTADKVDSKAKISDEKSGKALPDDLVESVAKQEDTDVEQLVVTEDVSFSIAAEELEPEVLNEDVSTIIINVGAKSDDTNNVKPQTASVLVGQNGAIKKNVVETNNKFQAADNSKLAGDIALSNKVDMKSADQENEQLEPKQQAQSLRSDILNALLKKPNAEGEKVASVVEQKIVTNSSLTPTSKEGVSEEQKIIALAENLKLKESLSTSRVFERSAGVSSVLLTPAPLNSNTIGAAAVSGQPTLNLQPALQSEAWSRVLSSRVIWMAREGVQQASLKLNPANMGSVEVKLHMHNEQASISFIAQNAATRDALEQALPRLRESFQENGMELAHADVSQEDFSQAEEQDSKSTNGSALGRDHGDNDQETATDDVHINEQDIAPGLSVFA